MTSVQIRVWTIVCDAPGCDAGATGADGEPWPPGWDTYFADDDALAPREAVRHACPEHAVRPAAPTPRTCQHQWQLPVPSSAQSCGQCGRRARLLSTLRAGRRRAA